MRGFTGKSAQVTRLLLIVATVLGVAMLSVGAGFSVARGAHASGVYDVCAVASPYAPCTFPTIQDAIDNTGGSPSNPATPLTTINVAPGTYNETVNITRSVTLLGANTGVDPNTQTRGAESIINAGGSNSAAVTIAAANVEVDGFTITGSTGTSGPSSGVYGPNASGDSFITNDIITGNWNGVNDLAGHDVYIEYDHIYNNSSKPFGKSCYGSSGHPWRCYGVNELASFSDLVVQYNTIDETYSGAENPVNLAPNFQRALSITPNTAGARVDANDNTLINSTTIVSAIGEFSSNNVSGDFGVWLAGDDVNFDVQGNTFTNLSSQAVFTSATYTSDAVAGKTNANVSIVSNTVLQDVGLLEYCGGLNETDGNYAVFDLNGLKSNLPFSNAVNGNTVIFSGAYNGVGVPGCNAVTSVQGLRVRSGATGDLQIGGNRFYGGNVGGTQTSGVLIDNGFDAQNDLSYGLDGNLLTHFTNGVEDNTSQSYVVGEYNCFTNNSSFGYFALGTPVVVAPYNWWGAANGPAPFGSGNAVNAYANPTGAYLTSAPTFCQGPVTTNVQSSVNPLPLNVAFTLTASLTTTATSQLPVAAAYYTLNGGSPVSMTTTSGTFGQDETVDVTASLPAFTSVGTYTVCVYGADTFGDVGDNACIKLDVTTANTTTTVTSTLNPSVYGQSVTFNVTVAASSGTPTGSVTLIDAPITLALNGSGQASSTTSTLTVGSHAVSASYAGTTSGSPLFAASSSKTLTQVVNKANTTTTVSATPNPATHGQTVTIKVHVVGAYGTIPTGSVTLKNGAATLGSVTLNGSGDGALTTSSLSVGTHNIAASYAGDGNHNGSTGYGSVTVTTTPPVPTGANNAYIRIVQASEAYPTGDIAIDGKVTFPNVAACTAQSYYPVSAGKHTFTFASPSGGATVITKSVSLVAGQYYTFGVVGSTAHSVTPDFVIFLDDLTVTPNQAKTRVYNLSDTLGSVKVSSGATVVASSLSFQSATNYTSQAPGTMTYTIAPKSGPAITDALSLSANQVYSVFLMCNGHVVNAAAAGVPQSLPQTGNGPTSLVASWLTPTLLMILLIAGAILLLGGGAGLGSYYVIARRRGPRV